MNYTDERIVGLELDNTNFERNANRTIKTIDKLDDKLEMKSAQKSMDEFSKSSEGMSDKMIQALSAMEKQVSTWEMAVSISIARVIDKSIDAATKLVESLSVDNISAGWEKYNEQTVSVGTLVAQGYDMEDVQKQLDRLLWYTDETSYNFNDMVNNISKFTAAGKSLDDSVTAMEGIANWAALSGQNATTASRAMYQLSQAISYGSMRQADYMSIQNANMDTVEFRQNCLDAAVALGTLKKSANGAYTAINKNGKEVEFTIEQFSSHLTDTGWLTSDVMMKTFEKYGSAIDTLFEHTNQFGGTASEAIDEIGDSLDSFGLKAFKAAQEARTFDDVINAVKDAVSTSWMKTFQYIFGNYEQATELWSMLAERMYNIFTIGGDSRNSLLKTWNEIGGNNLVYESLENIFDIIESIEEAIGEGIREIFPEKTPYQLYKIVEGFRDLLENLKPTESTLSNITKITKGVASAIDIVFKVITSAVNGLKPYGGALFQIIMNLAIGIADILIKIDEWLERTKFLDSLFRILYGTIASIITVIIGVAKAVSSSSFGRLFKDTIISLVNSIGDFIKSIVDIGQIDTSGIEKVGSKISKAFEPMKFITNVFTKTWIGIKNVIEQIVNGIKFLYGKVKPYIDILVGEISKAFKTLGTSIGPNPLKDILNAGFIATALVMFQQLSRSIQTFLTRVGNVFTTFRQIKTSLNSNLIASKKAIMEFTKELKTEEIKNIAISIGLLTASLLVLSMIDSDKLSSALGTLVAEMGALMGVLYALNKMMTTDNTFGGLIESLKSYIGFTAIANVLTELGLAMLLMSTSLKIISSIDNPNKALGTLITIIASFVIAAKVMSGETKTITKFAGEMLTLSIAINLLTYAIKQIGKMESDQIFQSIAGVLGVVSIFVTAAKVMNTNDRKITKFAGQLLVLSLAIDALIIAAKVISSMKWTEIAKAGVGILGIVTMLISAAKIMDSNSRAITKFGGQMVLLAIAIDVLTLSAKKLASLSWEQLAKAGLGYFTILGLFIAAAKLSSNSAGSMIAMSTSLTILAGALVVFGIVAKIMSSISWEGLAKTGLSYLLILGLFVAAAKLVDSNKLALLALGTSLAVAGFAMVEFATSLKILSTIPWTSLLVSLVSLGVIIGSLTALSLALAGTGAIAALISFSGAIAIFGIGILALGAGLTLFAVGVTSLGASATALYEFSRIIIGILPELITTLSVALLKSIAIILDGLKGLVKSLADVLVELLVSLNAIVKPLVDLVMNLVLSVLHALNENMYTIVSDILGIIIGVIRSLSDNIDPIVHELCNFLYNLVDALRTELGTLVTKLIDLALDLIEAVLKGIIDAVPKIVKVLMDVCKYIVDKFLDFFGIHSPSKLFKSFGEFMMKGLAEGFVSGLASPLNAIINAGKKIVNAFTNLLGIHSPSKVFAEYGKWIDIGLVNGIDKYSDSIKIATEGVGKSAINGIKNAMNSMGTLSKSKWSMDGSLTPIIDDSGLVVPSLNLGANISNSINGQVKSMASRMYDAQQAIDLSNRSVTDAIGELRNDLSGYYDNDGQEVALYVDSRKLATSIAKPMNHQLNILSKRGAY